MITNNMRTKYLIIGSGIGGLASGATLKEKGEESFVIVDKCKELPLNLSNGVHYLHSNDFGTPFPFELQKITAVEEIWDPRTDEFKKVSHIPEMVEYSLKVMNLRHPSSIQDPGTRSWDTFLPMSNDMNDLLKHYHKYIGEENFIFDLELESVDEDKKIAKFKSGTTIEYEYMITTTPLDKFIKSCGRETDLTFKSIPVYIVNYKTDRIVANWLLGIYISDPQFPPYRITILNNIISMESIKEMTRTEEEIVKYHLGRYFDYTLESGQKYTWETGRIFGLSKEQRDKIIYDFAKKDIHLLGRFATWNGKLLLDTTITQAKMIVNSIA